YIHGVFVLFFFFSSRRRHTRCYRDWSSDVCSSDLCWEHGAATFMILGDICTRACGFCAVPSGKPVGPPDEDEPFRVAEAVAKMGLRYAVVTSVNRDDQPDGGAHIFARTIEEIRRRVPGRKVEGLLPDFRGDWHPLDGVLAW